jgi:DNA-binding CsgD family transcriptional regulator
MSLVSFQTIRDLNQKRSVETRRGRIVGSGAVKRRPLHSLQLRVSSDGAQVRFFGHAPTAASDEGLESYIAVVTFDARSGALSAWLVPPVDRPVSLDASHRRPPSGLSALSAREAEVLERLALGEADKEISRVMAISTGTVKVHVKAIIRKLGVSNRTQAAIRAIIHHAAIGDRAIHAADMDGRGDGEPTSKQHHDRPDNQT